MSETELINLDWWKCIRRSVSWACARSSRFQLPVLFSILFPVMVGMSGCAGSNQALTSAQMQKLDPALQRLVRGESRSIDRYATAEREDGTTVYSVLLRSDRPEALQEAGLPLNSVRDDIATARLTIPQLNTAARLDAVWKIENPTQMQPTQ